MSTPRKRKSRTSKEEIASVVDALDDAPIPAAEARAVVDALGVDVKAMAAGIRAKLAAADRDARVTDARVAYAEELARLERRKAEPPRTRDEQLVVFRALLAKAPPGGVAMHFLKYEHASDDALAEMIRSLRHLVGEDDPEE